MHLPHWTNWVFTSGHRIESEEHRHLFAWDSSLTTIREINNTLWLPGEPSDHNNNEDVATIRYEGWLGLLGLNDVHDTLRIHYICEFN